MRSKINFKLTLTLVLILFNQLLPLQSYADSIKQEVLQSLSSAYGGKRLISLKEIAIHDHRKSLWPGQSESPNLPDFWRINEELTIDFANKRKSLLSWRVDRTNKDLEKYIVNQKQNRIYDFLNKKYSDDPWYNFKNTGRSIERTSDTLIARSLLQSGGSFKFLELVQYHGKTHYKLEFAILDQAGYHIFIEQKTGLITKISRLHPRAGQLVYVFSNHSHVAGIAFARDMNFFVDGIPRNISIYRNIDIKPNLKLRFSEPNGFESWGVGLDSNSRGFQMLAENVYYVGQGRSRTLFFDQGEYFISVGGNAQLADNYRSLQQNLKSDKPLELAILTHHHQRQIKMVAPAIELGAKLVTVESNLEAVSKELGYQLDTSKMILVKDKLSLANNNLVVHDIATAHAAHNLMVYLRNEKILFAEDHFEILYRDGKLRPFSNMKTFASKLKDLKLPIDTLVNGASSEVLSMTDFDRELENYNEPVCPEELSVCRNR